MLPLKIYYAGPVPLSVIITASMDNMNKFCLKTKASDVLLIFIAETINRI